MRVAGPLSHILLAAALCTGCATTSATLNAAEFRQRAVTEGKRFVLETATSNETDGEDYRGFVDVASGGVFVTQLGRQRLRVLHVRLTVKNDDADVLRVPLDQLAVEGIGSGRMQPAAVYGERDTDAASIVIPPGEVRATDVVFTLPSGIDVGDVWGFSLFWGVDVPGDVIRKATLFAPTDRGARRPIARSFRPQVVQAN